MARDPNNVTPRIADELKEFKDTNRGAGKDRDTIPDENLDAEIQASAVRDAKLHSDKQR
jgi:hypothetical protein